MNYNLKEIAHTEEKYLTRLFQSGKELASYINKRKLGGALVLVAFSSGAAIFTPFLLSQAIDKYISKGNIHGLTVLIFLLLTLYIFTAIVTYFQQNIMGKVGQEALYKLRATIFEKIQSLPIAFFNQNKAGDLMSRMNNDTDKLSQFLSESIIRFVGSSMTLIGIGVFVVILNWRLGLVLLSSTLILIIITRLLSPLLESKNRQASASLGDFTAGVSEQLTNFKAIIAFDRRNFFESYLQGLNQNTYKKSLASSFLNKVFDPIYDSAGNIAQLVVLLYGIFLISQGQITIGILIGFLNYALKFYDPLRYMADLFGNVQSALASWGRVRDILSLSSNLEILDEQREKTGKIGTQTTADQGVIMSFDNVFFGYVKDQSVLRHVHIALEKGKTYALVGPTGGGKSTMASLMTRLYDPTSGVIYWKGKDMRTFDRDTLSHSISVILQEPYLFSGTVAENIRYGNVKLKDVTDEALITLFEEKKLDTLIKRFPDGITTRVETGGENISIGQKQLISFVRTVLREPEFLVLDEATANIDTVTESLLQELIDKLPESTTKVIIAHRLNTIKKADEILFIGGGEVKRVGDSKEVLELLGAGAKA